MSVVGVSAGVVLLVVFLVLLALGGLVYLVYFLWTKFLETFQTPKAAGP